MAYFKKNLKSLFLLFAQSVFSSEKIPPFFTTYVECSKDLIRAQRYIVLDDSVENSIIILGQDNSLNEIIFDPKSQDFTMLNFDASSDDYDDYGDTLNVIYLIPKYNVISSDNNNCNNDSSWDQPRNRKRQRST